MSGPGFVMYEPLPGRVVFGLHASETLPVEVAKLGGQRIVVIDGLLNSASESIADSLRDLHVATIRGDVQHVPADLAASAEAKVVELRSDVLVAIGGGSATGLAKAVALRQKLPIIAIPTTYAGSEMTPIWGVTNQGRKVTGSDISVLPHTVIYDPTLTYSLPPRATAASGMNAVAHCVEAMWTHAANPITDAVALEGVRCLAAGLRASIASPLDAAARSQALRGAWLGGSALAVAGTALHHKICHVLGGTFNLPHADVHAAVLPWVVDHFREAVPDVLTRLAVALGDEDAVHGLVALSRDLGLSGGLRELGFADAGIEQAAQMVAEAAPRAPAPATVEDIAAILEHAMWMSVR
jgi:maleylacetate reductase